MELSFRMTDQAHGPRWQELGFTRDYMDAVASNLIKTSDDWLRAPAFSTGQGCDQSWVYDVCIHATAVFAMGSMDYTIPHSPLDDWREMGRRVVSASLYYFYSYWRGQFPRADEKEPDRLDSRARLLPSIGTYRPWVDAYRRSLSLAASLGDWPSADRLLEWPWPDLHFDEGFDDLTREDNAYQIWLACRLRGEAPDAAVGYLELIIHGKRRRPKMLVAAAQALLESNPSAFTKSVIACLRNHRQRELNPRDLFSGISFESTVLWHLAGRSRLEMGAIPHELMILIPRGA